MKCLIMCALISERAMRVTEPLQDVVPGPVVLVLLLRPAELRARKALHLGQQRVVGERAQLLHARQRHRRLQRPLGTRRPATPTHTLHFTEAANADGHLHRPLGPRRPATPHTHTLPFSVAANADGHLQPALAMRRPATPRTLGTRPSGWRRRLSPARARPAPPCHATHSWHFTQAADADGYLLPALAPRRSPTLNPSALHRSGKR